jgi:hypothetical protein
MGGEMSAGTKMTLRTKSLNDGIKGWDWDAKPITQFVEIIIGGWAINLLTNSD